MSAVIEIGVPVEELAARRERIEKTRRFERPDRIAVVPAIAHRYLVPQVGVRFRDYYGDPETMLRTQILAQKWLLENVRTDAYAITGPWVGAWTDFQNSFEAGSLGVDIIFPDDDIPWIGRGWVAGEADLRRLEAMDFVHSGINARQIAYRRAMRDVAAKYPVRFLGGPVFYPGENPALTHTSDGPFGVAGDLMGKMEIFHRGQRAPGFRPGAAPHRHRQAHRVPRLLLGGGGTPQAQGLRLDGRPGRLALGRDLPRCRPPVREAAALPLRRPGQPPHVRQERPPARDLPRRPGHP